MRDASSMVGTAHARLPSLQSCAKRLRPPYKATTGALIASERDTVTRLAPVWELARNPAGEALIDEKFEIAPVADRDGQAAVQGKLEARIVVFLRRRNASAARNAMRVLSEARRRHRRGADGQRRRNDRQAHRVLPLLAFSIRLQKWRRRDEIQGRAPLIQVPAGWRINSA